eukprot:scaffold269_cov123-Isochrysis_galbana.AAC.18
MQRSQGLAEALLTMAVALLTFGEHGPSSAHSMCRAHAYACHSSCSQRHAARSVPISCSQPHIPSKHDASTPIRTEYIMRRCTI